MQALSKAQLVKKKKKKLLLSSRQENGKKCWQRSDKKRMNVVDWLQKS